MNIKSGLLLLICFSSLAIAKEEGVSLDRTRVVFKNGSLESSVGFSNQLKVPVLVKTVFHDSKGNLSEDFLALPPLYRLDSGKENRIRLVKVGKLPEDKESVYFITVTAYPIVHSAGNSLRYGLAQRIKLFYRPQGVTRDCRYVANHLVWKIDGNSVTVSNPTDVSISLTELTLGDKNTKLKMLLPNETANYKINVNNTRQDSISFKYIDEYGSKRNQTINIK